MVLASDRFAMTKINQSSRKSSSISSGDEKTATTEAESETETDSGNKQLEFKFNKYLHVNGK